MAQLKNLIVNGAARIVGSATATSFVGPLTGNASTATKLATARTIALTGSVTGSGSFDGSGNLSITTSTNHTHSYAGSSSAGGAATSANKLNTDAGSTAVPVYFSNGIPVVCTTLSVSTTGNAATATKFASSQSVALTGDVTGSASSQAGWSITTTIGSGKVTNAMLAGSIANGKLANSSITVGDKSVSLGGTAGGSSTVISNLYANNYHVGTSAYITYNSTTGAIEFSC